MLFANCEYRKSWGQTPYFAHGLSAIFVTLPCITSSITARRNTPWSDT